MTAGLMLSQTMARHSTRCRLADTQVNVMDIRRNRALRFVGLTLLVSLAVATMVGGVMVIWTG